MNPPNGKANGSVINQAIRPSSPPPVTLTAASSPVQYTPEEIPAGMTTGRFGRPLLLHQFEAHILELRRSIQARR